MTKLVYLAVGTLAGGFSRYFLADLVHKNFDSTFPYGTLLVNISGCFIIGFLGSLGEEKMFLGPHGRILLMTGFCGAFTTFSTFMLETNGLMKEGEFLGALLNVILSVAAGFVVYRLGMLAGQSIS